MHGMLEEVVIELLQLPPDVYRFVERIDAPRVEHQRHVVTDGIPDGFTHLDIVLRVRRTSRRRLPVHWIPVDVCMDFEGRVSRLLALQCEVCVRLSVADVWEGAGISAHAIPGLT